MWLILLLLSLIGIQQSHAAAPTVTSLVNQLSLTNLQDAVLNKLYARKGMNRTPFGAEHDLCRDAIYNEFQKYGLKVTKDFFSYVDTTNRVTVNACNVIAILEGVQNTNQEVYIIGGHYDTKSKSNIVDCPGADDNATGLACQFEMARIFSQHRFAKTLIFAAYDGEERWAYPNLEHRLGSLRHAAQCKASNINVKAMVSVDMIGWQSPVVSNTAQIRCRSAFATHRTEFQNAISSYGLGLLSTVSTSDNMSDHYSFAQQGYPAFCLIEADYGNNTNYHSAADYAEMPNYLDWNYLYKMCRSTLGYYAEKLQPVDITSKGVTLARTNGGAVRMTFQGLPGCLYALEWAPSLPAAWTTLLTNTAGPDGTFTLEDTTAGSMAKGFFRTRFVSGYVPPPSNDIILDNTAATMTGSWATGTSSTDKYGADYYNKAAGTGAAYIEYRPSLPANGNYNVFEWHSQGGNRTTAAPIDIVHSGGTSTVTVNQTVNGGSWVLLGSYYFNAGTSGYVRIKDNFSTGSVVMADAIKFTLVP